MIDLVRLDLIIRDMDGWQVHQQMKTDPATRRIPVIVVAAKAQSIDKMLGRRVTKVDEYITKPFSLQRLSRSVERFLAKKGLRPEART